MYLADTKSRWGRRLWLLFRLTVLIEGRRQEAGCRRGGRTGGWSGSDMWHIIRIGRDLLCPSPSTSLIMIIIIMPHRFRWDFSEGKRESETGRKMEIRSCMWTGAVSLPLPLPLPLHPPPAQSLPPHFW